MMTGLEEKLKKLKTYIGKPFHDDQTATPPDDHLHYYSVGSPITEEVLMKSDSKETENL